jgi:drug/metabolite transporter (DMT)-like permease
LAGWLAPATLPGTRAAMNNATHPARRRAILMLILATLFWGVSFPVIKAISALTHRLVPDAGTSFLGAAAFAPRFVIAALVTLAFGWRKLRSATAGEIRQSAVLAFFASGGSLFQTDGLQFTDASVSAFLTQLSAILIPAILAVRSRRNPGYRVWAACALVLAGVAVLGHLDLHRLRLGRGEWETIVCAFFFVGQIATVGRKVYAGNRTEVVTMIMFALQAALLVAVAAATAPRPQALAIPWTSGSWVGLTVALSLVSTVGAFTIMNTWQPKITPTEAGLIYCIEPLFASIFALFLPALISAATGIAYTNERATASLLIGGGLITLANILVLTHSPKEAN